MKKCECGESLEEDWDVCPACGKPIEKKVICKGCGRELKPNWKLCPDCKTSVENFNNLIEKRHLAFVEGGKFIMGGGVDEFAYLSEPLHQVRVNSFYMGKYQVTQKLWKEIIGSNPSEFIGDNRPVENIDWTDAIKFCNALSKKDSLKCCYHLDGDTDLDDYDEDELEQVECNFSANGYRLPTEAEWEYAAKGGKRPQVFKYSGSNNIDKVAWYHKNSGGETHPVGKKKPNTLGIYDMSGNVFEWCWDWYNDDREFLENKYNPRGPDKGYEIFERITRGGTWRYNASSCLIFDRQSQKPFSGYVNDRTGLRIVKTFI